jgi:hypothetical protein
VVANQTGLRQREQGLSDFFVFAGAGNDLGACRDGDGTTEHSQRGESILDRGLCGDFKKCLPALLASSGGHIDEDFCVRRIGNGGVGQKIYGQGGFPFWRGILRPDFQLDQAIPTVQIIGDPGERLAQVALGVEREDAHLRAILFQLMNDGHDPARGFARTRPAIDFPSPAKIFLIPPDAAQG